MRIPHSIKLLDREHLNAPEVKRIIRDSLEHSKQRRDTKYIPTAALPALIRSIYAQHAEIPVRVINGDSHPHVDKAHDGKGHKRTSLLYLEGDGHLFLENTKIPIRPGLCVEFDADVKHWTEGSKKTKVMLGPMMSGADLSVAFLILHRILPFYHLNLLKHQATPHATAAAENQRNAGLTRSQGNSYIRRQSAHTDVRPKQGKTGAVDVKYTNYQ